MKKIFNKKQNIIITVILFILLIIVFLVVFFTTRENEEEEYKLNKIYDVYPDEVRDLYTNMLDISCSGSLHLELNLDGGEVKISDLNKKDLLNYVFGYLDKYKAISLGVSVSDFEDITDDLIYEDISLLDSINDYMYDDYSYTYTDDKINREEVKCKSDIQYVSDVVGYYYTENMLTLNVNMGYEQNGILYDLSGNKVGEYTDDATELRELIKGNSYYRYNYVNDRGKYKLYSVEWINKL